MVDKPWLIIPHPKNLHISHLDGEVPVDTSLTYIDICLSPRGFESETY